MTDDFLRSGTIIPVDGTVAVHVIHLRRKTNIKLVIIIDYQTKQIRDEAISALTAYDF